MVGTVFLTRSPQTPPSPICQHLGHMSLPEEARIETLLMHLGEEEKVLGSVVPPIFQNSLFVFEEWQGLSDAFAAEHLGKKGVHAYSRHTNPTNELIEAKVAAMEGTEDAKFFVSGMAAITAAVMSCVRAGSHVVYIDTVYGPAKRLFEEYLPRFGVSATAVSGLCPDELFDAVRPETHLIYLESPSSFVMRLQDLRAIATEARARGISTVIDNSYASPLFQQPHRLGIDLVVHSASKYLGGHSDVVAGVVAGSKQRLIQLGVDEGQLLGATLPPFPAWLILRAMRTLPLRMKQHQETGNQVAAWLAERPEVEEVLHVGLPSFPQRELFRAQMSGSGALLSFVPKCRDDAKIRACIQSLELFQIGVSWGGYESLVVYFWMQPMGWVEKRPVIRIYCGLEHPDDLMRDLERGLAML